jgi:YjbE family integral membrane protein
MQPNIIAEIMPLPELSADLTVLLQVLFIDVALAGDNAVVVGMAVAGLPERHKRRAIIAGIAGATIVRVALGAVTLQLLDIIGLTLAGGILLLWVCWKMFRELWGRQDQDGRAARGQKSLLQAVTQIMVADVSMSLDNVLAVAGAAEGHGWVLAVGLTLSVILMGVAAGLIARVLERHRWVAWLGLAIVLYVAVKMIWEGSHEVVASLPEGITATPRAGN